MEGEEFLFLFSYHRILAINLKKLLGGGFQTVPPDMTRLPVDNVIDFDKENLPCGMGFCVDGSKLYVVGGEWVDKDSHHKVPHLDLSKGNEGVSSSMCVADLFGPTVEFTHVHDFKASKLLPRVMNIKGQIYAMSNRVTFYAGVLRSVAPRFEVYDPTGDCKSIRSLQSPPFHESTEPRYYCVSGHAVVGNTICFEAGRRCHYYNVNTGKWRPTPDHMCKLLSTIHRHGLGRNLCHGNFVYGWEDVLVSVHRQRMEALQHMEAFLLPHSGSDEDAPVFCQRFPEVDDDLLKIANVCYIGDGFVLNLGEKKMCAIFPCQDHPVHNYLLYIYIFEVSQLMSPEQKPAKRAKVVDPAEPATSLEPAPSLEPATSPESATSLEPAEDPVPTPKDFLSITCLHKGFYNLDEFGYDLPFTIGAFYMRKNSKAGGEAVCFQGFA